MTEPITVAQPPASPRIQVLDYLRFAAAASVMAFHYFYQGIANERIVGVESYSGFAGIAQYGYLGVELFFLISGYVIFHSSRGRSARQFVVSRALRLLPAFWSAMLLTAVVTLRWGDASGLRVSTDQVLVNLTMVPSLFGVEPVDGVYWTLLREVQFYVMVLVFMMLGQRHRLAVLLPWWALGMLVISLVQPGYGMLAYLGGYFALFAGGALISEIHHSGTTVMRLVGLIACMVVALRFSTRTAAYVSTHTDAHLSPVVISVVLIAFFASMLALDLDRVRTIVLPGAAVLGALTYPVYLLHANLGYIALSKLTGQAPLWLTYSLVIAGVLALSYLLHLLVEQRMKTGWLWLFEVTAGRVVGLVETYISARGRPFSKHPAG